MFCKIVKFLKIKLKMVQSKFYIDFLIIWNTELLEKSNDDSKTFQVSINQEHIKYKFSPRKFYWFWIIQKWTITSPVWKPRNLD